MQFQTLSHPDFGLHILPTDKFKTNTLVLNLQLPLRPGQVTRTALIPYVLERGTARHPSVQAMQRALDSMYGSYLNADVFKLGERHVMQFRLELPNGKYLPGRPELLKEGIAFFHRMVTEPVMEGGVIKPSFVALEKEALRKRVEGLFNNKMQYARVRCVEAMCADEPYRLFSGGRIEDLPEITPEILTQTYRDALATAPMDMFVVGDVNPEAVAEELGQAFRFADRRPVAREEGATPGPVGRDVQQITESADVNQGQLVMGLRGPVMYADDDYYAMLVYNGVLGAFAHSKLFVNVREKESLCYSVRSRYDFHKGALFVQAGIDIDKRERAYEVIQQQLADMAAGEISDEELDRTRAMLQNSFRESRDSSGALINMAYDGVVGGRMRTVEQLAETLPTITKADLARMAGTLKLDTVYFLRDEAKAPAAAGV